MVICYGLNVGCPLTGLWFEMFVPSLGTLFWEAVEPLVGRALKGEGGHWGYRHGEVIALALVLLPSLLSGPCHMTPPP